MLFYVFVYIQKGSFAGILEKKYLCGLSLHNYKEEQITDTDYWSILNVVMLF